jgi:hypothetical protein
MKGSSITVRRGPAQRARGEIATGQARFLLSACGLFLILGTAGGMAYWTWGTWPDVLVDFGRELYIPWQLTTGKVLYQNIYIFHGPFSQSLNAVWFELFGVSLRTLVLGNLALLTLLVLLLFYIFQQVCARWTAAVACLTFVLLFAFAQYIPTGNYNYVCPYAHEMTHGLMFSLASLAAVWRYPRGGLVWIALAGGMLGAAVLTKAEVALPGLVASTLALGLTLVSTRLAWQQRAIVSGVFVGAIALAPVVAVLCLSASMPVQQAIDGAFRTWTVLASTDPASQKYFQVGMGTDNIGRSVGLLAQALWPYLALFGGACVVGLLLRRAEKWASVVGVFTFVSVALVLWQSRSSPAWTEAARPLPLLLILSAVVLSVQHVSRWRYAQPADDTVKRLSLVVFALLLLGKMLLNARIYHYGFVLAMPATLLLVAILLDWLPSVIRYFGGTGTVMQGAALASLGVAVVAYLSIQAQWIQAKTEIVGSGNDAFRVDRRDPRGRLVNEALREIERLGGDNKTLAVLPEGVMLNYLSRRTNPGRYIFFTPFDVNLYGEDWIRATFEARPPYLIAIVHKDTSEYGYRYFGRDYAQKLKAWIDQNYELVRLLGAPPLQEQGRFGILLLRHKSASSDARPGLGEHGLSQP